jgi:hypothetical protein
MLEQGSQTGGLRFHHRKFKELENCAGNSVTSITFLTLAYRQLNLHLKLQTFDIFLIFNLYLIYSQTRLYQTLWDRQYLFVITTIVTTEFDLLVNANMILKQNKKSLELHQIE